MFKLKDVDREILRILIKDGRCSFSELSRKLRKKGFDYTDRGVAERVRRLEEAGIILGYQSVVDLQKIGFPVLRVILIKFKTSRKLPATIKLFEQYLKEAPFCIYSFRVRVGNYDWINVKVFPDHATADAESVLFRAYFSDIIQEYDVYDVVMIKKIGVETTLPYTKKEFAEFMKKWAKTVKYPGEIPYLESSI